MSTDTIISGDTSLIDKSLTEKQIRGVDLVVKSASKKYPFILGWDYFHEWKKWDSIFYIDLYVDWSLASQFYNETFRQYYIDNPETVFSDTSALFTFFDDSIGDKDKNFMKGYNAGTKLKNFVSSLYEALPEEFQRHYVHESAYGKSIHLCTLMINDFRDIRSKK